MPQSINTNVASMGAQRNLNRTQSDIMTAVQRLSSGMRINSAKDDAAGIAVATRMTTQIGGLTVAIRNANDGSSVSQTAEGAMAEMTSNLNRAHDLAVQAASYNTSADRNSINQEVTQILDEMSRIVNQTRYNGDKLLTGGFNGDFQVGASVNETINVSIADLAPSGMGVATSYSAVSALSDANFATRISRAQSTQMSSASIGGVGLTDTAVGALSSAKITNINAKTTTTGVTAFSYGNGLVGATSVTTAGTTAGVTDGITAGALTVNGVSIGAVAASSSDGTVATALASAINDVESQTGVHASVVADPDGATAANVAIVLTNRTGSAITVVASTSVDAGIGTFFSNGTTSVGGGQNGAIILNQGIGQATVTYDGSTSGTAITGVSSATSSLADATLNSQTVSSSSSANLAMLVFESALDTINSQRSVIGAKLNRMEAVTRNLENVRENISAARGRIQDADFAEETAKLTRAQILQQAGTAMVAQANQLPQTVLSLLK